MKAEDQKLYNKLVKIITHENSIDKEYLKGKGVKRYICDLKDDILYYYPDTGKINKSERPHLKCVFTSRTKVFMDTDKIQEIINQLEK